MKRANLQFYLNDPLPANGASVAISNSVGTNIAVELTDETSMTISYETMSKVERIKGTATGGVLTITERGLDDTENSAEDANLKFPRRPGAIVTVTLHPDDILERDATETITGLWTYANDVVYSKSVRWPVYADATARDIGIPSPANGMMIYNTALGVNQQYKAGVWVNVDTGTTTQNASTTVAGLKEVSTAAENTSGASTGGTGAPLSPTPAGIAQAIQEGTWISFSSSTGSDTYIANMVPTLAAYTTNMIVVGKFTTANTGACSVKIGLLATVNIKTRDGNDPQSGVIRANSVQILIYDGTNFILQEEDFSTTANKGTIETATLAEQIARTSTSLAVTPEGLGAITQVAILQTSRVANTADGTSVLAHGLSTTPKWCEVHVLCAYSLGSADNNNSHSHGFCDGTSNKCTYVGTYDSGGSPDQEAGNDTTHSIHILAYGPSGDSLQTGVITFDATNVTITWDFTEDVTASTETMYVTLFVHT